VPDRPIKNYVAEVQAKGRQLRLCVTLTAEGDIVATIFDLENNFNLYLSYEAESIEHAKQMAEAHAQEHLESPNLSKVKWVKTI
jgi:hypothetical protein